MVDGDPGTRSILLTGAGSGFCSGAHLRGGMISAGAQIGGTLRNLVSPIILSMRRSRKPILAAVNGAAAGAGVGLALAADVVIAARSAYFVLSFARLGAALDAGTSHLVQNAIGAPRARAMAMLAEPLDATAAASCGLIWRAVDDERLMNEALQLTLRLADGPPIGLALIKQQFEEARDRTLDDALEAEAVAQSKAFVTDDLQEGARAFREKRSPRFVGR